jgi:hypothetical protein
LLSAVGCHLLFAVVGSPGWAIRVVQKPFTAERRPRDDRRAYCLSCRNAGRKKRDAARDYRRRQARRAQRRRAR